MKNLTRVLKAVEFGEALLKHRQSLNMTSHDVEYELGVSCSTVSRAERAIGIVTIDTYTLLCQWMNIPLTLYLNTPKVNHIEVLPNQALTELFRSVLKQCDDVKESDKQLMLEVVSSMYKVLKDRRTV